MEIDDIRVRLPQLIRVIAVLANMMGYHGPLLKLRQILHKQFGDEMRPGWQP